MNIRLHQITDGIKHQSVTFDPVPPLETVTDDNHLKMPPAVLRAGMTGMEVTLVFDQKSSRCKVLTYR